MESPIYTLRQRLGWSQADLGNHLGITRQAVSKLESGGQPRPSTAYDLVYLANRGLGKGRSRYLLEHFLPDVRSSA